MRNVLKHGTLIMSMPTQAPASLCAACVPARQQGIMVSMVEIVSISIFMFLPQIYSLGSVILQELKKDSADFSFFYLLKIFFDVVKINFYFSTYHYGVFLL